MSLEIRCGRKQGKNQDSLEAIDPTRNALGASVFLQNSADNFMMVI